MNTPSPLQPQLSQSPEGSAYPCNYSDDMRPWARDLVKSRNHPKALLIPATDA